MSATAKEAEVATTERVVPVIAGLERGDLRTRAARLLRKYRRGHDCVGMEGEKMDPNATVKPW